MDSVNQVHYGTGDNVAGDKIIVIPEPRAKYLNSFPHYDQTRLIGREGQLVAIDEHFSSRKLLAICGIGGIGKSTLSRAYISHAYENYDHIAFVEVNTDIAESMLLQLGSSPDVGVSFDEGLETEDRFKILIDELRRIPNLLLVIDNVNDPDDLENRKEQLSSFNATVLVTGRARPISLVQDQSIIEIRELEPNEAFELFSRYYTAPLTESDKSLVEQMLKDAFYNPKLIEVIAKSAHANAFVSLKEVSEIVGKKKYEDDEINYPIDVDDQSKKLYSILLELFSLERLPPDTIHLLQCLAVFTSVTISIQDLATMVHSNSTKSRQLLTKALGELSQGGWLDETDNRYFSMHALIQWVIREKLKPTAITCGFLIGALKDAIFTRPGENPAANQRFLAYLTDWLELFRATATDDLAAVFGNMAYIYEGLGNYQQELIYSERAVAIREHLLGPEDPRLATSYSNLGEAYRNVGNHEKRLEFHLKAVAIRERQPSPDYPNLVLSYNNLGEAYGQLGNSKLRLRYLTMAVNIGEQRLLDDHPYLAMPYNNIAIAYKELGDNDKWLEFQKKAIAVHEKGSYPDNPQMITAYSNLGAAYATMGEQEKRVECHVKAVMLAKKILPEYHPDLARAYFSLAYTCGSLGLLEDARHCLEKIVEIKETYLSDNDSELLEARNDLAITIQAIELRKTSNGQ
jgi:tetratricopeptide (TPR) repeat protein